MLSKQELRRQQSYPVEGSWSKERFVGEGEVRGQKGGGEGWQGAGDLRNTGCIVADNQDKTANSEQTAALHRQLHLVAGQVATRNTGARKVSRLLAHIANACNLLPTDTNPQ